MKCLTITVLGASGDLARKKTYPALFSLWKNGHVPYNTRIVGYARSKMSKADLKEKVEQFLKGAEKRDVDRFMEICEYVQGEYSGMS